MSDSESEVEVEVIEVKAANALVPNLTISVEKDDEEATVEFQEEEKQENVEDRMEDGVEVKLTEKSFSHTKIYENKLLNEIGLTVEEARSRKKSRAKRFQSPMLQDEQENEEVDQKPIEELIQKVKGYNEENGMLKEIRLDAVHLRGLDDMSTDEIFKFFSDHYPSHIEWIDDTSCNVVWKDETSAAGAILEMSRPNRSRSAEERTQQSSEVKQIDSKENKEEDDVLDLMESDDEIMEVEEGQKSQEEQAQMPFDNELRRCKRPFLKKGKKTLLKIRFATVNDKKTLGGANKSQYYRKYGNPNYGNVKGILSRSFKKRYHGRIAKREFEELQPEDEIQQEKKKVPTKRLYSEQAWSEAKRSRQESESSSEDEKSRTEREDNELINSSVKDLEGAIPVTKKDNRQNYDSMVADNTARKTDAEKHDRETSGDSGSLLVKVKGKGSVWDRLGNRSGGRKLQQDVTLPKSLQDRLGNRPR